MCQISSTITNPKAFVGFLGHTLEEPSAQLTVLQNGDYRSKYQPSLFSEELRVPGSNNISDLILQTIGLFLKNGSLISDGDSLVFAQCIIFTLCLFIALGDCEQILNFRLHDRC